MHTSKKILSMYKLSLHCIVVLNKNKQNKTKMVKSNNMSKLKEKNIYFEGNAERIKALISIVGLTVSEHFFLTTAFLKLHRFFLSWEIWFWNNTICNMPVSKTKQKLSLDLRVMIAYSFRGWQNIDDPWRCCKVTSTGSTCFLMLWAWRASFCTNVISCFLSLKQDVFMPLCWRRMLLEALFS